ncbi:MAG: polysaccharide pyruvyl transferase family protein [Bacteroidetes bacterium]|nr:polysaccharide pyruvyl transferase family protein [Bacteroidota bacterium]
MKEIKIAIIGAYPYNGNRGVGALSWSALSILKELEREWCNYNLKFFLINPEYGNKETDTFEIGDTIIDAVNLYPVDFFSIKNLVKSLFLSKTRRTLLQYRNIDFVINIGAGDSFADIYGAKRFYMFDNQSKMAFLFKKPLLIFPQTIGPFAGKKIKKRAISTIEKSAIALARDKQSYDFLKNETCQSNIDEIVDVAFFMPYQKKSFSKDFVHVGLNVSALLWHGGYTKNNQFELCVDYQKLIRNTIEYFLSIPNVKLHLVPHVVLTDYSDVENDYSLSFDLVEKYNNDRLVLSPFFLTPIFAKNYIAGMDFFAGARMHAAIAAFSSEVPVYPMAYSRKFNGLFADTLAYPHMGDMKAQTNDEILTGIQNAFAKRGELQATIHDRMTGIVAERKELLKKHLVEFLGLQ